ncbi:hypothetical protein Pelo_1367 [Pelomyxa schiedti]|nr:hypothetical protein Pelo_1367 [Pelomyxa schiedti]
MPEQQTFSGVAMAATVLFLAGAGVGSCYMLSFVQNYDSLPSVPGFSDVISMPPASCIGSVFITTAAALAMIVAVLKYCNHLLSIYDLDSTSIVKKRGCIRFLRPSTWSASAQMRLSRLVLALGLWTAFLLGLAACVQRSAMPKAHEVFLGGFVEGAALYSLLNSWLEISLRQDSEGYSPSSAISSPGGPVGNRNKPGAILRVLLCIGLLIFGIVYGGCIGLAVLRLMAGRNIGMIRTGEAISSTAALVLWVLFVATSVGDFKQAKCAVFASNNNKSVVRVNKGAVLPLDDLSDS